MIKEAVILAGGLGTRLRSVVDDLPKSMAPLNGRPFLHYILREIGSSGVERIILATGYKSDIIRKYFGSSFGNISLVYSEESEPLGTGGAIKHACTHISGENFFVINGDTLYKVSLEDMEKSFISWGTPVTVALKPMNSFDRYGNVSLQGTLISAFSEKQFCSKGLINGGVYIINRKWLGENAVDKKFSFEKDVLEKNAGRGNLSGFISDSYFIDIGIPEDYSRASLELND